MRRLILHASFMIVLALAAIAVLAKPAAPITRAQDGGTPTPASEVSSLVYVSEAPRAVMRPPFGETFDTPGSWLASGGWRFGADGAYEGSGWALDGTARGQVSTLEYGGLLDLSGTMNAQLIFRQRGRLPETDIVALELSLDGGASWIAADQQIGVDAAWEQRAVDLRFYRGQVVRLRFRVTTGTGGLPPDDAEIAPGYAIDNLALQFFLDEPARVYFPIDTRPKSLLGLHLIMGAQQEPVVDLARRLRAVGHPMASLKATTGSEGILSAVRRVSPETTLIYRSLETPDGLIDCPNQHADPVAEAQRWMYNQYAYWRQVDADYYEIMNECNPPADWLVPFATEAMRIANEMNICILVFSFAGGTPEPDQFAQLAPVYEYALDNPCGPQRYHGVALHAYSGSPSRLLSESGAWLGYRHRKFYEQLLPILPEAYYIPVYITEAGPGDGREDFSCDALARDMVQFTREIERDPYIRGFDLWNVGSAAEEWVDVTRCLPALGDALVNYYLSRGPAATP